MSKNYMELERNSNKTCLTAHSGKIIKYVWAVFLTLSAKSRQRERHSSCSTVTSCYLSKWSSKSIKKVVLKSVEKVPCTY